MFEAFFHGHYGNDTQANYDALKYTAITTVICFLHGIFAVVYMMMSILPMAIYNILVVILYSIASRYLSNLSYYTKLTYAYTVEIVIHCVLSTFMVGWDYCFMYYLIALIPVAFYIAISMESFKRQLFHPIIITVIVTVAYFTTRIITYFVNPIYTNRPFGYEVFFCIVNSIITFSCTLLFTVLFSIEVNSMQLMMEAKQEKLEDQACFDPLTHFRNRRSMDEKLNNAHKNAIINNVPYSLIMCDIDNFKSFNDTYGHDCGDYVLQNVSRIIATAVRAKDSTCRWGGEEFLILISDSKEIAAEVAERIRSSVDNYDFYYEGKSLHVTLTLGVSTYYSSSKLKTLIEIADKRLYKGKENGKNQVVSS